MKILFTESFSTRHTRMYINNIWQHGTVHIRQNRMHFMDFNIPEWQIHNKCTDMAAWQTD